MKIFKLLSLFTVLLGVLPAKSAILTGPITNPANGHKYLLLDRSTWKDARSEAWSVGGHLVAINDEAENSWLVSTFGNFNGVPRHLWIGFSDRATEGIFRWVNGQPNQFTNWGLGEPNNANGEHYAELLGANGLQSSGSAGNWNDLPDAPGYPVFGVVEIEDSPDTIPGLAINPATGHRYVLLTASDWTAAEAKARQLGGDLVTINDAQENEWLKATFGAFDGAVHDFWIGLNDATKEGTFVWSSGEVSTFNNWEPNEPNNAGKNEHYGQMRGATGKWNDLYNHGLEVFGIVEFPTSILKIEVASVQLSWFAVSGKIYQVQFLDTSNLIEWQNDGAPVPGTDQLMTRNDDILGKPRRLYRVLETP